MAFLHHLGIPSLNLGFDAPGGFGTYHSIFDSFTWFTRYIEPDLASAPTLARIQGLMMLRLSEADLLAVDSSALARLIETNLTEYADQGRERKASIEPVRTEWKRLLELAARMEAAYPRLLAHSSPSALQKANARLRAAERALTVPDGLTGRPWYKHTIMAPGVYTGYSARVFPGVNEALDAGRSAEAATEVARLAAAIAAYNVNIESVLSLAPQ